MTSIVQNKANVKMGKTTLATDRPVAPQMLRLRLSLRSPKDSMTAGADRLDRYLKKRKCSRSQNSVLALSWRILTAKREIIKVLLRFLERIFNQIVDNTSKSAIYPVNAYEKTKPIYLKRGRWRAGPSGSVFAIICISHYEIIVYVYILGLAPREELRRFDAKGPIRPEIRSGGLWNCPAATL